MIKKNKRIGIWGFGIMGKSAADYLHVQGYQLSIMDKRTPTAHERDYLHTKNISWYDETQQETFFNFCDIIIPSSGVNITALNYATHKNKWLHELDFFYHTFHKPIIAVTGSIGKTSVVSILNELFKAARVPVCTGGNIGTPTFDLIAHQYNVDYALLEVSSFQLAHCAHFAPIGALWTNLYPNHLDYHTTEQDYFLAKQNMLNYQTDTAFSLIPWPLREKTPTPSASHRRGYFLTASIEQELLHTLHDNEQIYYLNNNNVIRYAQGAHTNLMTLTPALLNLSFIDNILLVVATCDMMQINNHVLHSVAHNIQLPAHRIEFVGSQHNVDFYNDSKATTTASTRAAVEKLKNRSVHLFIGGLSKGVNRAPFIAQLKNNVKHIYCFGHEAHILHAMCRNNNISATHYATLDDAFAACMTTVTPGDCVLLSPSGSSYDLYENYEQRGDHFKKLVNNYKDEWHSV